MSEPKAWYHCGRCGHFYESAEPDACPECGRSPIVSSGELLLAVEQVKAAEQTWPVISQSPVRRERRRVSSGTKNAQKSGGVIWFALGWLVFLGCIAGIVGLVKSFSTEGAARAEDKAFQQLAADKRLTEEVYPKCYTELAGYLSEISPERRATHTLNPGETMRRMQQAGGRLTAMEEGEELKPIQFKLFETQHGEGVASLWETARMGKVEAVFRLNAGKEWKIDWDQMARYSSEPWAIFLAGSEEPIGEFRLWARLRDGHRRASKDDLAVVFTEPAASGVKPTGLHSPDVMLGANSQEGKLLLEAFERRDKKVGVFGTSLANSDPIGMVRVRVRLERGERNEAGEYQIRLVKILAFHWMEDDDPGVSLPD